MNNDFLDRKRQFIDDWNRAVLAETEKNSIEQLVAWQEDEMVLARARMVQLGLPPHHIEQLLAAGRVRQAEQLAVHKAMIAKSMAQMELQCVGSTVIH